MTPIATDATQTCQSGSARLGRRAEDLLGKLEPAAFSSALLLSTIGLPVFKDPLVFRALSSEAHNWMIPVLLVTLLGCLCSEDSL